MSLFSKLSKNNEKNQYPWTQKKLNGSNSALPRVGHAATCVSSDAMVIFGGIHKSNTKKELFYIDINTLNATSINASGDAPTSRITPSMVTMNGHVILYGGRPLSLDENYDNGLYILNIQHRKWSRMLLDGPQPVERWGHSAVANDGIMYVFGGQKEGNYFNDLFIFDSSTFGNNPHWEKVNYNNECPEPRSGHISAFHENKIYIFGGTNDHYLFNDIWSFDLHTGLWSIIDTEGFTPSPRESCAASIVGDILYIIGGKDENGADLNDLCAYKIKSRCWFKFQNMGPSPSPRHGSTMTAVKDRLYVFGGDNESSRLDDSSAVYVLDSTKIKYPADTPPSIDVNASQQQQHHIQQHHDTSPIEGSSHQQHLYQEQQHHQTPGGQVPPSPQQQQQQQRQNSPTSPIQQQPLANTVINSEMEMQHSPQNNNQIGASPRQRAYYPDQNAGQPPTRPPRHSSAVPEAALRRPRATSPLPNETEPSLDIRRQLQTGNNSPMSLDANPSIMSITEDPKKTTAPPRPPREGLGIANSQRNTTMVSSDHQHTEEDIRPNTQTPVRNQSVPFDVAKEQIPEGAVSSQAGGGSTPSQVNKSKQQAQFQARPQAQQNNAAVVTDVIESTSDKDHEHLLRELQARESIIAEMKQKENWWRTEVSLARKLRIAKGESFDEGPDADESLLMDVDHLSEDKVKLFEQLVSVKSELRRVRGSILQQAQPMSDKVSQADRMRTAALQEAAYFKSKYLALKSRRQDDMAKLETSRSDELEKRLAAALSENEANSKLLLQLQKQSQHDQAARYATEERAREAQTRAEEAQQAHQRALEELQVVYARATKAEVQVRDNAVKIADLTQQLSEALRAQPTVQSHEITDAHLKASQLEAANLKARNETAHLKQKLAEQLDEIARLKNVLQEREDQLSEAKIHVEDYEIQLNMMRENMNQQPTSNGYASTKAY